MAALLADPPKELWLQRKSAIVAKESDSDETDDAETAEINYIHKIAGFEKQYSAGSEVSTAVTLASTTHSLEELSSEEFLAHQCEEIDAMAELVVFETAMENAIQAAVTNCPFAVTVADPNRPGIPLIAVSNQFEAITGFARSELIGKNCRCLKMEDTGSLQSRMHLRRSCATGASFTGVLTNRRKSGECFLNLLDLRGLTVARNPWTGEELWFLVGIQADVTSVAEEDYHDTGQEHLRQLTEVAWSIREKLLSELTTLTVVGALSTSFKAISAHDVTCQDAWVVLPEPVWKQLLPTSCLSPLETEATLQQAIPLLPADWSKFMPHDRGSEEESTPKFGPSVPQLCVPTAANMEKNVCAAPTWQVITAVVSIGAAVLLGVVHSRKWRAS